MRKKLRKKTRSYKFRLYPNREQRQEMETHLWLSKNLWNEMLDISKRQYRDFGMFPSIGSLQIISKNSGLHSQVAQDIGIRLNSGIWRYVNFLKKKKETKTKNLKTDKIKRAGFPRFKNITRVKSLHYPQSGFSLKEKKLKVSPFGEINIKKHREIQGKIKTLTLKKEPSNKWYAIFTAEAEPEPIAENNGTKIGVDLGLINFAVFSDGKTIHNPKHLKKHEEKLKKKDYKLSKKKRRSKNSKKEKRKRAVVYEKVKHIRKDFLHKLSKELVHDHSLIALEDLSVQDMAEENYGKSINDAGWSEFANMLAYKAESAGCRVVFVNPKNTTKECSDCRTLIKKDLWERQHNCPSCGLSINRDLNAAINILNRAQTTSRTAICSRNSQNDKVVLSTAGSAGSNACGDGVMISSLKQEAPTLTC